MSNLTIARLRLRNFKCYRYEHVLELEPRAYAIFATEEGNPDRSNFLGKSSLEEAVDFALFGRLPDEFSKRKRGWVSRGEKSGEVELELSDGSRILRSQTLSASEKLYYFPPGASAREGGAYQAEAQKKIEELVGLSREDFAVTRYFRQGEMSKIVSMEPGPRLEMVAGWFRLGALQGCEDDAADALSKLARRRDEARARADAAAAAEQDAFLRVGAVGSPGDDPREVLEHLAEEVGERVQLSRLNIADLEKELAKDGEREALLSAAMAYDRAVLAGRAVSKEICDAADLVAGTKLDREHFKEIRAGLQRDLEEASAEARESGARSAVLDAEARAKRTVATGRFDGRCPLLGEGCPAREHVERRGRELAGEAASAAERAREVGEASARAERERGEASAALARFDSRTRRLLELREEAARLRPSKVRWEALSGERSAAGTRERLAEERRRLEEDLGLLARYRKAREDADAARERAASARAEAEELERSVRVASAAAQVFGKGGAQRRMAEGNLAEIEELANEMMAGAGLDLGVRVAWSREGSGVASTCAACGCPFPRSERVKACERCGAERGQKIINSLEIEPTRQSGGARDLAGIFVQFAAAAWLVEERGARWATAMLDEPLAALDRANRRAVSAHLPAILRRAGVSQALVIGHDRGALDALPGRIVVESRGGWSTVRVEAA